MQKLHVLQRALDAANYAGFWREVDSDDLYADLIADVSGFEEVMRVRIAACVGQSFREVERAVLEGWLSISGEEFEEFIRDTCAWKLDGDTVLIPLNKENEAKGTVLTENVKFERKFHPSTSHQKAHTNILGRFYQSSRGCFTELTNSPHSL